MYNDIFELHSNTLKALSHPKRLEIIHLLRKNTLNVREIQMMLDLPQANLSQHLQILRDNNVVTTTRKGKQIFYKLSSKNYVKACDLVRAILVKQHAHDDIAKELTKSTDELFPIVVDPVCGMRLSPKTAGFVHKLNGVLYYFCASGCLQSFVEDTERYAA